MVLKLLTVAVSVVISMLTMIVIDVVSFGILVVVPGVGSGLVCMIIVVGWDVGIPVIVLCLGPMWFVILCARGGVNGTSTMILGVVVPVVIVVDERLVGLYVVVHVGGTSVC